jgi:hypothetical protein
MPKAAALTITVVLIAAGLVHLLPAVGALGAQRLNALYGVAIADPSLLLLMRHRAVLFGLVGALMLHAAIAPPLQVWALGAGLLSTLSFVVLAVQADALAPPLRTVMWIDIALAVALVLALLLRLLSPR